MLIRPAEPDDAMDVARVHVRAWQVGYRDLLPDDYLARMRPEERARRYTFGNDTPQQPRTMVAIDAGAIRGFATIAPARDINESNAGELCALYVDPDWWGHGVGAVLISAARVRLLDSGFKQALLWVLKGNARAERFYRNDHWIPDGICRTASVWGLTVDEVCYRRGLDSE
ncbi:Ribosomal protein S18 acetylase RimI [Dyella sp. OK004]|uniref:GNAT family N-acetyltransferase n=1 Tax=Dyella sp. OK004 TaxID=1855292 RepID=UPI0008E7172E|nr:GNAT family N-acetyltransferase [Dyella sp. OK004]SFR86006.1 Ribosomal protein S18 acetylase RimI [Dyella sp. OK004]